MDLKIDIDEVIKSKNPRLAKWLPGFVRRYIKRTVHQDEINRCLTEFGDRRGTEFIGGILDSIEIRHTVEGAENVPPGGRYIFASNHSLGGLDGMVLALEIEKRFGSVKLIVNDLLMNLEPLKGLFVPVNKHGRQPAEYAAAMNDLYESDVQIITFPFGLCSRRIDGKVQDGPWKKNFVAKAVQYKRDVVPVYFEGQNSAFFYNLARLRKRLGIKANIEMFYLPDEMFKQRGKTVRVCFGKPIPYGELSNGLSRDEWAARIRKNAYSLKKQIGK